MFSAQSGLLESDIRARAAELVFNSAAFRWVRTKSLGKVTPGGQALTFTFSLASVLLGDMLFYTFSFLKVLHSRHHSAKVLTSVAPQVFQAVWAHSWELMRSKHGLLMILFALVGTPVAAGFMQQKKPKFTVRLSAWAAQPFERKVDLQKCVMGLHPRPRSELKPDL